jgi:hypothetical protein
MSKILIGRGDTDLDYPICRPSLDLDFTQEELDSRITFTRGSTATRVNRNRLIESVAANQPRFDYDPVTGECKGLLIEESRTNLLTYSEDFNSWTKFLASVSTNTTIAPDGNTTADTVISNGGTTTGLVRQDVSGLADNTTYTFSVFLKTAGLNNISLQFYNKANTFHGSKSLNLSTGALTENDTVGTSSVVSYGNGWYRLILTNLGSGTGATTPNVRILTTSIGNGTSGIYIWGAQLEAGAFPTSYIPTTASTVTRSADTASMTGTNFSSWYNSSEGTFFTQAKSIATVSGATRRFLEVSNGGAGQRYLLGYSATSNTRFLVTSSSVNVVDIGSTASPSSGVKMCASYSTNNFAQSTNGVLSTRDLQGVVPTVDRMIIGWDNITTNAILCGTISRLTYYPRALKPNQLQLLTQ